MRKLYNLERQHWQSSKKRELGKTLLIIKKPKVKLGVAVKKEKQKSFVNFCEKLNRFTNPTDIWEKVKCFKNRWTQTTQRRTDAETKKLAINNNIDTLCAPWARTEKPKLDTDNQDEFLDRPYSLIELEGAIAKSKEKSAPGIDGIDYNLITLQRTI